MLGGGLEEMPAVAEVVGVLVGVAAIDHAGGGAAEHGDAQEGPGRPNGNVE